VLYVIFYALDGRELYACPEVDMMPEECRETKRALARENGILCREIYVSHAWR